MTKNHFYYPSADGRTKIHAIRWDPEQKPAGIVQIIHGMIEFIDRYDAFAKYLAEHGFLAVGEDHLGHGESVVSDAYHGYFGKDGNAWMIKDIHHLREMMQEEFPDTPYLILGHSMGSFLALQYITEEDARFAEGLGGAAILGTGWQPPAALAAGKLLAKAMGTDKVGTASPLLEKIAMGSYLKRIPHPRTVSDWLTKDTEIVDQFRKNPWNTFHFTPNAFYHMFSGMQKAHDLRRMKKLPEGLPLLFASGEEDPVGGWGKGVRKAFRVYAENTKCKVDLLLYPGCRHEILNETERKEVFRDLRLFFEHCLGE
ncbi:MAG: alpha/beta hydrolase [Blautia sp.]|nr:alpha/beta hydrolase [Blautia sp.]